MAKRPVELDRSLTFAGIFVGLLCALGGIYQAFRGSLLFGAALVWIAFLITGALFWHLIKVNNSRGKHRE